MTPVPTPAVPFAQRRAFIAKISIDSLPVELLAQILVLWASIDDEGPWMAASVCKHWRRVVLGSTMAWSNISLILKHQEDITWCIEEDEQPPRGKRRPFELWLQRNGDSKLSLKIVAENNYPLLVTELVNYCNMVSEYAHRLRHFALQVELLPVAETVILSLLPMSLDTLKVCVTQARTPRDFRDTGMHVSEGDTLWNFLASGHAAKTMVFEGCVPRVTQSQLADTVALEIQSARLWDSTLVRLVKSAHCLTTLKLHDIYSSRINPETTPQDLIALPALRHLSLRRMSMDFCADVFSCLNTPSLETLAIENGGLAELRHITPRDGAVEFSDLTAGFGKAFTEFSKRTPDLHLLCITKSGLHDRHLVEALQHLTFLYELQMDCLLIGAPVMRALTPTIPSTDAKQGGEKPLLCPYLQRLEILRCDLLQGEHLVALIRGRNQKHPITLPIVRLTVGGCKGVGEVHAKELRGADPEGLHLRVQLYTEVES